VLLQTLQELSALASIRGDEAELALLARAGDLLSEYAITSDADLGPLLESDMLSDGPLRVRLRQMYDAGAWVLRESAIADLPADLRWLFESGAVTLEQLARLHQALDATALSDLLSGVRREAIRAIAGFDQRMEAAIAGVLPSLRSPVPRIPLGKAMALSEPFLTLARDYPGVEWAEPAGSLRRGHETVGDIELVAPSADPRGLVEALLEHVEGARCLHRSARRLYVLVDGVQIGVRCPPPPRAGAVLLHMTGSHDHVAQLCARAERRGGSFRPDGLSGPHGEVMCATEADVYSALGLPWIPAEIRSGEDELRAAETGTLPMLVSQSDIRGDLHLHTEYSDGRDTVEAMVQGALALGYEYVAVTDHSPHSAASRSLSIDSVNRQRDEIADLRERYPAIAILHGCEVDILADGRLDFPDRVLEQFDIVLASLHERANHGPDQLLQRYLGAMRHTLVDVITHPTNRLVPHRLGYDLNYDRLFAAAVETGTVVEIDGAPAHMDLDGTLSRRATLAGAMVAINSDSHRAEALERQMALGLKIARRGWVEARHVLNTRPLGEVRALIASKRKR
jgi:DNA polymerase (family 10)